MSDKPTVRGAALGQHAVSFEGLLEAVPDALVGVDQAGVIRFVNHQTESLFGYDRTDLVGQCIETLVPESFRKVHPAHRDGYVAAPKTREMGTGLELRGQRRDGTEFPVDIALSHVDTGDGVLVIAAVRDISDRQKAEQGRRWSERLAAVVEYSGDAIISNTPDGIITSFNPAAERMYGYSSEEIIGKSGRFMTPEDRIDEADVILAEVGTRQSVVNFETIGVRKDGTVLPVSLTVSPILDVDGT